MAKWTLGDGCEGGTATPKYSKLSETIRHKTAGSYQCRLFCGGQNCKYETSARWKKEDMAVEGIFSHWVTDRILAMARPNTALIKKCDLIQKFHSHGIKSVVNLQEVKEHANCGPPLEPSGFSYNPQDFMDADIFFYNFGWKDYGVPTMNSVFDMVKVIDFALQEGKVRSLTGVAIHCHAGLGRTGVVIACYLVYAFRLSANEAILCVRSRRPNSVQTRGQMQIVQLFADHIQPMWVVFPTSTKKSDRFTYIQYLKRQRAILHGTEARKYQRLPKIVHVLCKQLIRLTRQERRRDLSDWTSSVVSLEGPRLLSRNLSRGSIISDTLSSDLPINNEFAQLFMSRSSPTIERQEARPLTPSRYFQKRLSYATISEDIDTSPISTTVTQRVGYPMRRFSIAGKLDVPETSTLDAPQPERRLSAESPYHRQGLECIEQLAMSQTHYHVPDDFLFPVQPPSLKLKPPRIQSAVSSPSVLPLDGLTPRQKLSRRRYSIESNHSSRGSTESDICPGSVEDETTDGLIGIDSCVNVVDAFLCQKYDNCVTRKAEELKRRVNGSTSWQCLYSEQNPCVLVLLLTTWFQLLLEPPLPCGIIKQLETRLKDVEITSKDVVQVFDKPQELLVRTLSEMLVEVLEGLPYHMEEVVRLFAKLLTVKDKDTARDEMLTESRVRHGAVQTLIAMAHKFLPQRDHGSQQDNTDDTTGLQPIVIMTGVLTRIIEEKLKSHNEANASSTATLSSVASRFLAGGSSPTRELPLGAGKLTCMESECPPVNRSISNLSFGKKRLPPIGEMVGCDVTEKD